MQWVTAGGNHSSDFYGDYAGITLSYGRKTGVASNGPKFSQPGVRIFDLEFDPETGTIKIDTWIRQKDGTIDDQGEEADASHLSFLKLDHCYGSESPTTLTDAEKGHNENFWIPNFLS